MENEETQELLAQLQFTEQNVQNLLLQKQTIQSQLLEIESTLEELEKEPKKAFKIVGSVMVESTPKEMQKDLKGKKELLDLKMKSIEKQEEKLKEKSKELQEKVLKRVNKNE